jgi:cytochrome P450
VRAVLADADHFDVDYPKAGPHQIVGMRNIPEYRELKDLLLQSIGGDFQSQLRTIVQDCAADILAKVPRRFDLVSQYSRVIAIDLTHRYLGIPADPEDMKRWTRTILRDVFLNISDDPKMFADAELSRCQLNDHIHRLIQKTLPELDGGAAASHTFFGRLLTNVTTKGLDRAALSILVRDLMAGLVTALADNISNTIARSTKYLLDYPLQFSAASDAANEDNPELLLHYISESLRFNPETPLLIRVCSKAITLAPMTSRVTTIPAGTVVLAAVEGAMFDRDPSAFPDPEVFRSSRPLDRYLHFGSGMHQCFGREIAETVLPAAVGSLLKLGNLRRVRGLRGRATYDGAFPKRLLVEFD